MSDPQPDGGVPPRPPPSWPLPTIDAPQAEVIFPFALAPDDIAAGERTGSGALERLDFGASRRAVGRIVVLKLDHLGDFVMALPAMQLLREAFPAATIRLICGRWNEAAARQCGLVDEIRCFNYFPERAHQAVPGPTDPLRLFDAAVEGRHDLAIDLRVDEDSRHLLARIDARLRCGIGSAHRYPLLDIAMPDEYPTRLAAPPSARMPAFLPASSCTSPLELGASMQRSGPLGPGEIFSGLLADPPAGRLIAQFGLAVRGHVPGPLAAGIHVEVLREDGEVLARRTFGRRDILRLRRHPVALEFDQPDLHARLVLRGYVTGRPWPGVVTFSGVTVQPAGGPDAAPLAARLRPVELHVGERLSLLASLVRERTRNLYGFPAPGSLAPGSLAPGSLASGRVRVAVAPFSNSAVRTWPRAYYQALIAALIGQLDCEVTLLGSREQAADARAIAEAVDSPRLVDLVGRTQWTQLRDTLCRADLVICNNSGIAHQAAALGARVLAIYSGSHQPREWGPRGMRSRALMQAVPCSPCGFEQLAECVAEHACMRLILPETVLEEARAMLAEDRAPAMA